MRARRSFGGEVDVIKTRWTGGKQWTGWDDRGHGIVMDTPLDAGGTGTGLRPVELLLMGLAGCTGIDVESILRKKREDVRGIEVNVTGTPRLDDWPHYYERIEVEYVVTGVGVKPASVERAIELSETKYCSVKGCLGPQCVVSWTYRIIEFEPSVGPAES